LRQGSSGYWISRTCLGLLASLVLSAQGLPQEVSADRRLNLKSIEFLEHYTGTLPPSSAERGKTLSFPIQYDELQGTNSLPSWLRAHFDLSPQARHGYAVYLLHASPGAAIYLNGAFVGASDGFGDPRTDGWNYPLYFTLPADELHAGRNDLLINLGIENSTNRRLDSVVIGPAQPLYAEFQRALNERVLGVEIVCACVGLIGLFAGVLWLRRRSDVVFGLFALSCLLWILRNSKFFLLHTWMSRLSFDTITDAATFWLTATLYTLCFRILGSRFPRIEMGLFVFALTLTLAMVSIPSQVDRIGGIGNGLLLPCSIVFFIYLTWRVSHFASVLGWLLWLAAVVTPATAAHDYMVQFGLLSAPAPYLMPYSALFFAITVGWLLVDRFVRTQTAYEGLNAELEARLRARENELALHYAQMAKLERERATAIERDRILRDMHDGLGLQLISSLRLVEKGELSREQTAALLVEAMDEMRIAIDSVKPSGQDLLVVLGNLRYRLEPRLASAGISLRWQVAETPGIEQLAPHQVTGATRIVQEAFTNAMKHSRATEMCLSVGSSPERAIQVTISDNGCGFDATSPLLGEGLKSMRKRAAKIGATLDVRSRDGETCIELALLPVSRGDGESST
jgi:signal transduction histidine kinase